MVTIGKRCMKIWVVGKKGLLGKAFCATYQPLCVGTCREEVDISKLDQVRGFLTLHPEITHILNAAAYSLVDQAEQEKEPCFRDNVIGPLHLARAAQEKALKLIHISTDYVFKGNHPHPLKESDATDPINYYGTTKLEGEKQIQAVLPECFILRTSWIFGSGGKNFIAKLLNMFQTEKEIFLSSDQWGRPTYVGDLCKALFCLLDHQGLYHFANQGVATKYEFGHWMYQEALKLGWTFRAERITPVSKEHFPGGAMRPSYSAFDTSKIEAVLPFQIRNWQDALKEFLCNTHASSLVS